MQYAYTGDVKKLKTLGFKFGKYFARNYKAYAKDRMIMFVVSKMVVELDDVRPKFRKDFIQYILDNKDQPKEFWLKDIVYNKGAKNELNFDDMPVMCMTDHGNIMDVDDYNDKRHIYMEPIYDVYQAYRDGVITEKERKEEAAKLKDDNGEFNRDLPMFFGQDIVAQIIELNNLHPLELIGE